MALANGAYPLDAPCGLGHENLLEGQHDQPAVHGVEQFLGTQQEIGIRWPPEARLACRKGLIDEDAVVGDAGDQIGEDRPPEIIGHDNAIEDLTGEGRWCAGLQIEDRSCEVRVVSQVRHAREITINPGNVTPPREEQPGVPPSPAGDIEDRPVRSQPLCKTADPGRRDRSC